MPTPTVLVVDDEPLNLEVLSRLLRPMARVLAARSGPAALALLESGERPGLILLDVMMPGLDGYAVMERLRAQPAWREIPVIFVTALHDEHDEEHGFELGAVDFIAKPIRPAVVLARVRAQLELKQSRDRLADHNAWLGRELAHRLRDAMLAQDLVMSAMAQLAETRDSETGHHILRTQAYVELLAHALAHRPRFAPHLGEAQLRRIVKAAPMHDIGKIGIPDAILLKPGRLDGEEFEVMKQHSAIGGQVFARAMREAMAHTGLGPHVHEGQGRRDARDPRSAADAALPCARDPAPEDPWASPLAGRSPDALPAPLLDLEVARVIALHHHERFDGLGYPQGLAGDAIPVPARLMAVADVFDALTTRRPYKTAWSLADAFGFIEAQSGRQFDPEVVEALLARRAEVEAVACRLAD